MNSWLAIAGDCEECDEDEECGEGHQHTQPVREAGLPAR